MEYPKLFEECIAVVLKNEGGYVNNPVDPGGETNMGIAKKYYPDLDIKNLTKEQAIEIYYKDYWMPMRLDFLADDNLILHVFDMGVNAGKAIAVKLLQRLVATTEDGILGTMTAEAVMQFNGNVVLEYIKRRKLFYITLAQKKEELHVFLKGWINRVDRTKF